MDSVEEIVLEVDHIAIEGRIVYHYVETLIKYIFLVNGHIPQGYEDIRTKFLKVSFVFVPPFDISIIVVKYT